MGWISPGPVNRLHVTNLGTGRDTVLPLPGNWLPASEPYPPPSAGFDPAARRLVLLLNRVEVAGNATAEDLFVADTVTRTVRMIPAKPFPVPAASAAMAVQLAGAWEQQGLLLVLAANPGNGYYQLASWTGAGPLHTLARQDVPITLSAPGPG